MRIVTLTLNPCVDETVSVSEFGEGALAREYQTGGKGMNVARVLARFGIDTLAVAPIGRETGEHFAALAREEGIPLCAVPISGETRTITTYRRLSDDAQKVSFGSPPEMTDGEIGSLMEALKDALPGADALCVCGSACCKKVEDAAEHMIALAKSMGIKTLLDTKGYALSALPDMFRCNTDELFSITGKRDIECAANVLLERGVGCVLVTMGDKGAAFFSGEVQTYCPAPKVQAVNPVGSGDSFTAGFLYAESVGANLFAAMRYACACGAANAKVFPASRIAPEDVMALL
ncbi:MAG: 1-phosphofructokinase family hexose kinase [Christensenellales bacterium]|jgi:1-phosphofructokinase family hexose kinase